MEDLSIKKDETQNTDPTISDISINSVPKSITNILDEPGQDQETQNQNQNQEQEQKHCHHDEHQYCD